MKTLKTVIYIVLVSLAITILANLLIIYQVSRDEKIEESAKNYQACVLREYQQTPEECRDNNNGEYCTCK